MPILNKNSLQKILIVGVGSMGMKYIQIIQEYYPQIQVGVLRRNKINDLNVTPPVEYIFDSIHEALLFNPDAAIFSNPASLHVEFAKPFAKKGVNLLIEKPLSNNYKEGAELVSICESNNVICMMAYNLRYLPSLVEFKNLLDQECVGDIYSIKSEAGSYLPKWRENQDYRSSVSAQKFLGGGVLNELSHELDYIQWIFGGIKWVSASLTKQSKLEIDVEDSCSMILGIADENTKRELISTVNLDFIRHDSTRCCLVTGSKGSLKWNGLEGTVEIFPSDGTSWKKIYSEKDDMFTSYIEEVKQFFNSIHAKKQPVNSGRNGLKILQVIEAAKESSNSGKVVKIDKSLI
jgi:predicted dehydrogenase